MEVKCYLSVMAIGKFPEIHIDKITFDKLKASRECLSAAFSLEEKYEILLSNYIELEKECLTVTAEQMVRGTFSYSGASDRRLTFNRRLINLLTSTRLYIDQAARDVRKCNYDAAEKVDEVKSYFAQEYDLHFEYRFMEALRNYVQHYALGIHLINFGSRWISDKEEKENEYNTNLYAIKNEFEQDRTFKRSVLTEMPDKVNIVHAVKTYLECLSKIHCKLRDCIESSVEVSRRTISDEIVRYEEVNNGNALGLHAVCEGCKDSEDFFEKIPMQLYWDEVRLEFIKNNKLLSNLNRRYVSGSTYKTQIQW